MTKLLSATLVFGDEQEDDLAEAGLNEDDMSLEDLNEENNDEDRGLDRGWGWGWNWGRGGGFGGANFNF